MKIKILKSGTWAHEGKYLEDLKKDQELDIIPARADRLIEKGWAEFVEDKTAKKKGSSKKDK